MKLAIAASGMEVDAWLRSFVRTNVAFAVLYRTPRIEAVAVDLTRLRTAGSEQVRCRIYAETKKEYFGVEATGANASEAVTEAVNQLEVSLQPTPGPRWAPDDLLAA